MVHLAATLKKLLTILLLVVLATQISGNVLAKMHEISFTQETDEKAEKSGEVKSEKEYIHYTSFHETTCFIICMFGQYCSDPTVSPVMDHLTPPPDVIS